MKATTAVQVAAMAVELTKLYYANIGKIEIPNTDKKNGIVPLESVFTHYFYLCHDQIEQATTTKE